MIRVVLGGEGLAGFPAGAFTDHYVKLLFPPAGATYGAPFDVEQVRAELPAEQWPMTRTYTVRAWDAGAGELTIDFVWHGDEGVAGPWAATAAPGDRIQFFGPGGGYAPRRTPTGPCWPATRAPCRRSGQRWSGCPGAPGRWCSSRWPGPRRSRPTSPWATGSSCGGCTAATPPRARRWWPRCAAPHCPRAPAPCSCTAKRAPSGSCAGTCATRTACLAS